MNVETRTKQLIRFLERNSILLADFYRIGMIGEDVYKIRLVPHDYDIREIPSFKKYCKLAGLSCTNEFGEDVGRTEGYQQYHDCYIKSDETLFKNKLLEDLYEEN